MFKEVLSALFDLFFSFCWRGCHNHTKFVILVGFPRQKYFGAVVKCMVNHYSSYNDVTAPHQVKCEKFDLVNFWFLTSAWYTFWHSFGYCTGAVAIIAHMVRLLLVFRANSTLARLSDG